MDGMLSFSSAPASLPGFIGMFLLIAAVVTGLVSVFTGHKARLPCGSLALCLYLIIIPFPVRFFRVLRDLFPKKDP